MKLLDILKLILGEAEQIVPIFIHNPKSQQIEAVVATTANAVVSTFGVGPTTPTP